jgi:hypothetical protein
MLPFCTTFRPICFHVVTIIVTIIFGMLIAGGSLKWHLVAVVDIFWGRDRNIESITHRLLRVHQDDLLITFMTFTTSLLILRDGQYVQRTLKMNQLVWQKWYHSLLWLANVLNQRDDRHKMMFVKDYFSRRYFCKRLLDVPGTLCIIFLYPNHRVQ